MKLRTFIFISILLHAGGVWFFRPKPTTIQDLTEMQVIEALPNSSRARVASPPSIKSFVKDKTSHSKMPIEEGSLTKQVTSSPATSEVSGSENKMQPVQEGVVSESPRVLQEKKIPYPLSARRAGVEGVVELKLVIDTEGRVREAEIVKGPGYGLDEAALSAIKEFIFSPAKIGNDKVAVRILYKYRFRLGGNG